MLERILRFSLRARWAVIAATAAVAALGAWNLARLPIDAVPDITNVQVQINIGGAGLFAAGSRAAHHLPDRDGAWPACRASSTPARCRATACRR